MSHNYSDNITINKNLEVYYIRYDLRDVGLAQCKNEFYEELFDDIPNFAFGTDIASKKSNNLGPMPTVREAMRSLYSIKEIKEASDEYLKPNVTDDKYIRRGEFGELLLFHLLREYYNADALISKIYFKDSASSVAHGFDAVHVDKNSNTLWLGESKLYKDSSKAINELVKDVESHFNVDFFNSEFQIITNRIDDLSLECNDFIKQLLNPKTMILDKLAKINICLFAAFESETIKNYDEHNFEKDLREEINKLNERMNKKLATHQWIDKLNIYLFAFPLENKVEFVSSLHEKLRNGQKI